MNFKLPALLALICAPIAQASEPTNIPADVCFNCPALDKIADASTFDDASYYTNVLNEINNNSVADIIKNAISTTISEGHKNLTYSEVWTALTQTDEDPNNTNNVILLYRGISLAKSSNGSGSQSTNPDNWNREHVWAKSHGFSSSSLEAYTDIHHLRPTDISVNSSRGNLDFDNSDSPLSEAPANRVDGDSFEPRDAVKGDVARMVFYMDARYQGADSTPDLQVVDRLTSTGEAALGRLCRMIEWHNADPVDAAEQTRNNRIYEFQGNRNPFIDHPEWVSLLYTAASCENDGGGDTGGGDNGGGTGGGDNGGGTGGSGNGEVYLSEYIEGSGSNKAIEIYNPAENDVDLSAGNYQLGRYSNGSTSPTMITLTGTINAGGTFVIVGSSAVDELKAFSNQISGSISHNGDDAYVLFKDGAAIDSFGRVGEDPGSAWVSGDISTKDRTLVRKSSVSAGDTTIDDAFDPAVEWEGFPVNTFDNLGSHNGGGTDPVDPIVDIGQCGDEATLISAVQGSGSSSTLVGETHTIEAVVTGVFPALNGFFVQEETSDEDNLATTSEGLFIKSDKQVVAGDVVRLQGDISESYGKTLLTATETNLNCGTAAIAATTVSLPFASTDAQEALEGMLVTISSPLTVSDNYNLGKYGEVTLSNGRLFIPTNQHLPGSAEAINLKAANALNKVILDDGINGNPDNVIYPTGGLTAQNTLRSGDTVSQLTGMLDYSYGKYRIIPTQDPTFIATNARTDAPDLNQGNLTIAGLNVLNLFNGDGNGGGFPTSRGADSVIEYERQITKTVAAIASMNADIVGLMEIENDGFDTNSTIVDLVNRLNTQLGADTYAVIDAGGAIGTDEIAVGLLYKPATVTPAMPVKLNMDAIFNRPPLAQMFSLNENNEKITVVVNHFKSKGGCGSASGADTDQGDGQACFNAKRVTQAQTLMAWLNTDAELNTESDVLVIGDLNAYAMEDPIRAFTENGYTNLQQQFEGQNAYSYLFGGEFGYLDHALASSSLAAKTTDTKSWHINADEPLVLDYNLEYKSTQQQSDYYAADAYRMSDHDPVMVSVNLEAPVDPNITIIEVANVENLADHHLFKFEIMLYRWQQKIGYWEYKVLRIEDRIAQLDPVIHADNIARKLVKIADLNAQIAIYQNLVASLEITLGYANSGSVAVSRQTELSDISLARLQYKQVYFEAKSSNERAIALEQRAAELMALGQEERAQRKLAKAQTLRARSAVYHVLAQVLSAAL